MPHVIIIGPPGCGKGTISKELVKHCNLEHLSTGDLLRTIEYREIQDLLKNGSFVSDEKITKIVLDYIKGKTTLLDGFPRTLKQAKFFDKFLEKENDLIKKVIYIKVPNDECVRRIKNRKDNREDDNDTEVIQKRIETYQNITEPIIKYYKEKGLVSEVDGLGDVKEVFNRVKKSVLVNEQ